MGKVIKTPQEMFKHLEHWQPVHRVYLAKELLDSKNKLFPLFSYLYDKLKKLYSHLPLRRNGEAPFIHPINSVLNLRRAKIEDAVTICAGLTHDYLEEVVDLYKLEHKIKEDKKGIKILDNYEEQVAANFEKELIAFCLRKDLDPQAAKDIIALTRLLTRHKRDFYYSSISGIFHTADRNLKEKAIQIKLADRTHNILCIESFSEQERNYQCFKNIFILNNAKKFIIDNYGISSVSYHDKVYDGSFNCTERLFNKCCKATYDAFLTICLLCGDKFSREPRRMLQMAFKKFAFEVGGLDAITKSQGKILHPMRLYYGVVQKYDTRLHQEWQKFEGILREERVYCQRFFSAYKPSHPQIQAMIDYKDAYSLKEVVAHLLYQPDYFVQGFLFSQLSKQGRLR